MFQVLLDRGKGLVQFAGPVINIIQAVAHLLANLGKQRDFDLLFNLVEVLLPPPVEAQDVDVGVSGVPGQLPFRQLQGSIQAEAD